MFVISLPTANDCIFLSMQIAPDRQNVIVDKTNIVHSYRQNPSPYRAETTRHVLNYIYLEGQSRHLSAMKAFISKYVRHSPSENPGTHATKEQYHSSKLQHRKHLLKFPRTILYCFCRSWLFSLAFTSQPAVVMIRFSSLILIT